MSIIISNLSRNKKAKYDKNFLSCSNDDDDDDDDDDGRLDRHAIYAIFNHQIFLKFILRLLYNNRCTKRERERERGSRNVNAPFFSICVLRARVTYIN
jgi:hypothetical protein